MQDISFSYLGKSVSGMKERKSVTGARGSKGGASVRRDE